jgi:hypothetical protein
MVRLSGVGDIPRRQFRHVARVARISVLVRLAIGELYTAIVRVIVALQAPITIELNAFTCRRDTMRVVTRRAPQLAVTLTITRAGHHLVNLTDGFCRSVVSLSTARCEYREDLA